MRSEVEVFQSISLFEKMLHRRCSTRFSLLYLLSNLYILLSNMSITNPQITAQKMEFPIKDFFSKCDQIRRKLRIWSHLLKKSLVEKFIFCAVIETESRIRSILHSSQPIRLKIFCTLTINILFINELSSRSAIIKVLEGRHSGLFIVHFK